MCLCFSICHTYISLSIFVPLEIFIFNISIYLSVYPYVCSTILYMSVHQSVCLSKYFSNKLFIFLSVLFLSVNHIYVCPSIFLCVHPLYVRLLILISACRSIHLSVCLSISLSIWSSLCLFALPHVYRSICLSLCNLFIFVFVYLSVFLPIHLYMLSVCNSIQ